MTTTVTDGDGDHVSAPAQIRLIDGERTFISFDDDGPLAVNDVNSVTGSVTVATGNVITENDVTGTDGAKITEISGVGTSTILDGLQLSR